MSNESIADRFIITMAEIKALDALNGNEEPMRFQVRALKGHAERIIDDAIRTAWAIADTAKRLQKDAKEAALTKEPT